MALYPENDFTASSDMSCPAHQASSTGIGLELPNLSFEESMAKLVGFPTLFLKRSMSDATTMPSWQLRSKRTAMEKLWLKFFSDPSQWWDHRSEKVNQRFPDFKHKRSREALWLQDSRNPPWVESKLASIPPGTMQLDVFSWTQKLSKCNKSGNYKKAMEHFKQMQLEGLAPDRFVFVQVLNACAGLQVLEEGKRIHLQIIETGCEADLYIGNSLVDMYAKCGSIEDAWKAFIKMPTRDVVGWTAMILGYVKCGQGKMALALGKKMHEEGVAADSVTFVGLLNACSSLAALDEGRFVHEQIIRSGFESDIYVGNSLVDMYAKCGSIGEAWRVFTKLPTRDVVGWTAIILGFAKCGEGQKALKLYQFMQKEGVVADSVTFVGLLNACASLASLDKGRLVHKEVVCSGFESDIIVSNALVDMYAKCGSVEDAWKVFKKMPTRNVVGWTAMILGYVKCGQGQKALKLSQQMQNEGVVPDPVTFGGLLNACASLAALDEGRRVHEQIIRSGFESDIFLGNSLVDMYAKCGSIEDAWRAFTKMPARNVVGYTAMIGGYAMHGHAKEALRLFEQMCLENVEIDQVTFVCLLSACSHGGLVEEGLHLFESMTTAYGVSPTEKHYACMVDLLGRADRLADAEEMVKTMSVEPDASVWMSLLGACRIHGNLEIGERAAQKLLELDPENAAGYVLLSNLYAGAGLWDMCGMVRKQRLHMGAKKTQGRSWIEVNNEVHSFVAGDNKHPQILEIRSELKRLTDLMKETGYLPDTRFALYDEEEDKKEVHLCHHSEKLAIAFGLISTPEGSMLRITKNLRVCGDCHNATKFIAKIVGRKIVVRDANRFHHFQDGICSCRDYW